LCTWELDVLMNNQDALYLLSKKQKMLCTYSLANLNLMSRKEENIVVT
jgi:hypothetical protein